MPRIQILPPGYSFSSELGKALGKAGEGFTEGMQKGLASYLSRKGSFEKNLGSYNSTWRQLLKDEKLLDSYDREKRDEAFRFGEDLLKQGVNHVDASKAAIDYLENPDRYKSISEKAAPGTSKIPPQQEIKQRLEEPKQQEKEFTPRAVSKNFEKKHVVDMSVDELRLLAQKNPERLQNLSPEIQEIVDRKFEDEGQRAATASFAKGYIPFGLGRLSERKLEEAGLVNAPLPGSQVTDPLLQTTGELYKDFQLLKLAGGLGGPGAVGTLQRGLGTGALFAAEKAGQIGFGEGRKPGVGEVAQEGATLGAVGVVAESIPEIMRFIKRIPGVSKTLSEASKASGVSQEQIVAQAASNLEKRGIEVLKATQGDAKTLNELQKETNRVAKSYSQAEKFNQKETEKVRQEVAKKLPESPLEEYYAPKKEVKSRPETVAKEAERVKKLNAEKNLKQRSLVSAQRAVSETTEALRAAKASNAAPEVIQRLEAKIGADRRLHNQLLNEIKNLEFEVKHGRAPLSSQEIQTQIDKSFAELRQGIENPTVAKLEKVREGIERDKKIIDQAQKLAQRGQIPGPEVFDEYIKIHEKYNKGYGELQKELKDFIRKNKPVKARSQQVQNAEKLLELVGKMKEAGEAKVLKQIDKRRAMRALDRPSGAFYRQMLKDLRKDISEFQKDFFQYGKITSPEQARVQKTAQEAIKSSPKEAKIELQNAKQISRDAESVAKNPTKENVEKLGEATGLPNETLGEYLKRMRGNVKEAAQKVVNGTATEATEKELIKSSMQQLLQKYRSLPPVKRAAVGGVILGTIQGLGEEFFGYKIRQDELGIGLSAASGGLAGLVGGRRALGVALGTGAIARWVHQGWRSIFDHAEAAKLAKARNTPKFNEIRKDIEKRYGARRTKRIIEESKG